MRIIALLALCFAAVSAAPENPQRIVGGSLTTIDRYPTIVSLVFARTGNNFRQLCGGSILNNRAILTAAHCPHGDTPPQWRVRVGSTFANSGGAVHNVNRIINHPNYNTITKDNDIGVMRLASTITMNNNARAISIAGPNYNLADNQVVWAAGWGAIRENGPSSEQLRHVQVWTINQNTCVRQYAPRLISLNMLCSGHLNVGGRDQCQGDSGGPLYHNGIQVGVCSWGNGCARPNFPGVNARVSRYTAWIQSNS